MPIPTDSTAELDAEELLHLALQAMEEDRDAEAITFLKRGLALDPSDGRLHYLLGAMHAQLGMFERAIGELKIAVQLAPHIDMAHFQLGLLQITSGEVDEAKASWSALDELGAEHPLNLFRAGMLAMGEEDWDTCIDCMRRGIVANEEHESLNRDMERVIATAEEARSAQRAAATAPTVAPAQPEPVRSQHVLLAGYQAPPPGNP